MAGNENGSERTTPQGSLRDALKAVADEPAEQYRPKSNEADDRTRIVRQRSEGGDESADAESTRLLARGNRSSSGAAGADSGAAAQPASGEMGASSSSDKAGTVAGHTRMGMLKEALHAVETALGAAPAALAAKSGGANQPADQPLTNAAAHTAAGTFTRQETPPTVAIRGGGHRGKMEHAKTQMVRGQQRPTRTNFHAEPVVGWLVVIGGPGLGAFRPVFEGNNTIGRAANQRVPIDFGDDSISNEEQAYIRYDSADRTFLFVPNLAKTNVVAVNDAKPTSAVKLNPMDVVTMGTTQMVFVPFCGEEFDWSELADLDG